MHDIRIIRSDVAVVSINQGNIQRYVHNDIFTYGKIPYATEKDLKHLKKWKIVIKL